VTLALLDEGVAAGARIEKPSEVLGLAVRTVTRWRTEGGSVHRRADAGSASAHKLTPEERETIVSYTTSAESCNLSPRRIVLNMHREPR
jgi:putative transposase